MTLLRLLADDLTGALDTAAEFVPLTGALPVVWSGNLIPAASGAIDSGTRESEAAAATAQINWLIRHLEGADIAFKKIDSLLRGPTLAEIAACMRAGIWRHCALAPAFPYQGRFTRGSRQYAGTEVVSGDLVAELRALGVPAYAGRVGAEQRPGVSVFDAETDEDLQRIVSAVRRWTEPVLWAGTGGLAQAMAAGLPHPARIPLPGPILGVFGSDQAATSSQLAACEPHWLEVADQEFDAVPGRLADAGLALVSFGLSPGTPRALAAERIAAGIRRLIDRVPLPGTIVVAGGETLRSVCDAAGATSLLVRGRLLPGVPLSVMVGGRWNGVTVVSKSGAFGHPGLLRDLILERTDT
jgi:uncharacterized protein YgbK (DUF1537 family)